jgi:hypothetical protein
MGSTILKVHYASQRDEETGKLLPLRQRKIGWRPGDVGGAVDDPTDSLTEADFAARSRGELWLLVRFPGKPEDWQHLMAATVDAAKGKMTQRRRFCLDLNLILSADDRARVNRLKPLKRSYSLEAKKASAKAQEVFGNRKLAGQATSDRKARALEFLAIVDEQDRIDDELRANRVKIINVPDPVGMGVIVDRGDA